MHADFVSSDRCEYQNERNFSFFLLDPYMLSTDDSNFGPQGEYTGQKNYAESTNLLC
jgi:hypothetical protein